MIVAGAFKIVQERLGKGLRGRIDDHLGLTRDRRGFCEESKGKAGEKLEAVEDIPSPLRVHERIGASDRRTGRDMEQMDIPVQ